MEKQTHSLAYCLGLYLGSYIEWRYLPTLSTDDIQTNNVIKVMDSEADKAQTLSDKWFAKTKHMVSAENYNREVEKQAWIEYRSYYIKIEKKYLPETFECYLNDFIITDYNKEEQDDIIQGVIDSLWNSDCCSYSLKPEDISFEIEERLECTIMTFKLDVDKEIEFEN